MVIKTEDYAEGSGLKIKLSGRFDFSVHKEFRETYRNIDLKQTTFIIDLSNTRYLDSAALGMLLVLRERAGGSKADITLIGYNDLVGQIFEISRFEQLFKMEASRVA